ncbi:hypothetical protein Tco_0951396 [Tanacetum coccineum]|uniref:PB1-like domain-containing protein n=1 Tax=Tanacetum coccineum TaxID=301880 RepID=A0ABQ5DU07_9ASTR
MAFISSSNNNTSSTNEAVNTAHRVFTASTQVNAANSTNIDNLSDAVICAFFTSQPNIPQLIHEDLQQIYPDDMEEMDLRWQIEFWMHFGKGFKSCKLGKNSALEQKVDGIIWFRCFDVHHDGVFVLYPLRYKHDLVYDWKLYKNKKMDYKAMCEFLKEKADHAGFTALYFCLPKCDLEVGLKIIERDSDVATMYDFADSYGKLDIFMSHIHQNLAEFYFQNLNMEESGDEATSRLRIHEIMVKDTSNISYDELVSWAEEEAEMQTPKNKVVEHVVDDVDIHLMNLVEIPKLKRKLLARNSPSPIAKRKLMGKVTSPINYVVNKGRSVLNEGNTVKKPWRRVKV